MDGKHVAIAGIGLVILEIQCEHTSYGSYWLTPLDLQSRVVAYDVGNLVLRIRIVVRIGELHLALRMVVRNMIFPHV
ncbi:hypothetical protein DEO72_LG5g2130 [Vigna unguiculata]|uniref:Uncharacterized protein n=1 Tax=Vigna unguiculata TaxID=3917 RepID=A0A4D6LYU2_VIGUN|nr:hypothetical protein DEO72_LG5g2130 [Vigna unguiculata]